MGARPAAFEDLADEPFSLLEEGAYNEPLEAFRAAGVTPNVNLFLGQCAKEGKRLKIA